MAVTEPSNTLARPQSGALASSPYLYQLAQRFADSAVPRTFSTYSQSVWRSQFNLVLTVLSSEPLVLAAPAMFATLKKAESAALSAVPFFDLACSLLTWAAHLPGFEHVRKPHVRQHRAVVFAQS